MYGNGAVIVAFDHAPLGLLDGLGNICRQVEGILPSHPSGVVLNLGVLKRLAGKISEADVAAIMRLDGNQTYLAGDWTASADWELFYSAETAVRAGAAGAIVNLVLGGPAELSSLKVVARAAAACGELGIPLYVSAIVISNKNDLHKEEAHEQAFAARMAFELGADYVNLYGVSDPSSIEYASAWCDVPIIAQGAPRGGSPSEVANWAEKCGAAGAYGVCVGQAVWGSADPGRVVRLLSRALSSRDGTSL
jgi:fructose-bisphosphate aldolase / 2-amino-3,7-dideoxy-D-threo-hept-6-ulosonate synthase